MGILENLLARFFATDVKKLLKSFEIVRSSVTVSLSIFRLILLEDFAFLTLIIDQMPYHLRIFNYYPQKMIYDTFL